MLTLRTFLVSLFFINIISINKAVRRKHDAERTLTYPLTDVPEEILTEIYSEYVGDLVDFFNGNINVNQYRSDYHGNYKWSNNMINIIDDVEYNNFGEFLVYMVDVKNAFRALSAVTTITKQPDIEVVAENILNINFCLKTELININVRIYDVCVTEIQTFNKNKKNEMELITTETTSDGDSKGKFVQRAFKYASRSRTAGNIDNIQEILDNDSNNNTNYDIYTLINNPILRLLLLFIILPTLLIGIIIGCIITKCTSKNKQKQTKISTPMNNNIGTTDEESNNLLA